VPVSSRVGERSEQPLCLRELLACAAVLDLAREDFCEAWAGDEKLGDEAAPFGDRTGLQKDDQGRTWIYGQFPLPSGLAVGRVTELRFGREWKIDGFEVVEEKKSAKVGGAHATVRGSDDFP
jgi:hypothetical protein